MPGQVNWRADLAEAKAIARRCDQLLFVAVHEVGNATSEQMWNDVLSGRRFAEALGTDVLPVLVALVANGGEMRMRTLLPDVEVEGVRRLAHASIRDLFGPNAKVSTPQQLVLDNDGSVLWQGLRGRSLSELRRGLEEARAHAKQNVRLQQNAVRARAARLGKLAVHDEKSFEQLAVVTRHAIPAHFGIIIEALAGNPDLVSRLLTHVCVGMDPVRVTELAAAVKSRRGCSRYASLVVAPARADLLDTKDLTAASKSEREILAPLPVLRVAEDLQQVRFGDGRVVELRELRGRPTVLMFLLRSAPNFAEQLAALKPEVEDLQRRGVACMALFAGLDPETELAAVRTLDLPCRIGAYAFDQAHPYQGVGHFPSALVLDDETRVVYADADGPGTRTYAGFAPTARGLARYLRNQPMPSSRTPTAGH